MGKTAGDRMSEKTETGYDIRAFEIMEEMIEKEKEVSVITLIEDREAVRRTFIKAKMIVYKGRFFSVAEHVNATVLRNICAVEEVPERHRNRGDVLSEHWYYALSMSVEQDDGYCPSICRVCGNELIEHIDPDTHKTSMYECSHCKAIWFRE